MHGHSRGELLSVFGCPLSFVVQAIPNVFVVPGVDVSRHYANAAMIRRIVPVHQATQDRKIQEGVGHREITVHTFFESAIEAFRDAGFRVSCGHQGGKCRQVVPIHISRRRR